MSKIHEDRKILVFTTPKELRKIADEMERQMPLKRLGESTTTHAWCGDNVTICLSADQDAYHAHQRGNPSKWA